MATYKHVDESGRVTYSDHPPNTSGTVKDINAPATSAQKTEAERKKAHKDAKDYIGYAKKYIPKTKEYFDYLDYLRNAYPWRFEQVMQDLRKQDPEVWAKLIVIPRFQPYKLTPLGRNAAPIAYNNLHSGASAFKYTGSIDKWFEATVTDLMKRDRWGPYADVLGTKATTLPTVAPIYSNSRLGQYMEVEDARAAKAAKDSAKGLESARAAVRGAASTAVTRVGNPLIDLGIGMLDTQVWSGANNGVMYVRAQKLYEKGVLDDAEYETSRRLISQSKYKEFNSLLEDAERRFIRGAK
jgi:Domain of unknown function (DUF4124)